MATVPPTSTPKHHHDDGFEQAGEATSTMSSTSCSKNGGDLGEHVVDGAGFLTDHHHLGHHVGEKIHGAHGDVDHMPATTSLRMAMVAVR